MNKCFFIGKITEVNDFKFILNDKEKHKSEITLKLKLLDKNEVDLIAYNKTADYILRNNLGNSNVLVQGKLQNNKKELQVEILHIEKI